MNISQKIQQALDDGKVLLFVSFVENWRNCDCVAWKEDEEYVAENYDSTFQNWHRVTRIGTEQLTEIVERGTHSYAEI